MPPIIILKFSPSIPGLQSGDRGRLKVPRRDRLMLTAAGSVRIGLILDTGLDGFQRLTSAGDDEVARRPEGLAPELADDLG